MNVELLCQCCRAADDQDCSGKGVHVSSLCGVVMEKAYTQRWLLANLLLAYATHTVRYARNMEQDPKKIPWPIVESHLTRIKRKIPWLADQLGIDKNAIYNWPNRGGVPMAYLLPIADALGISQGELLENGNANSPIRGQKRSLSDAAERLIFSIVRLDGVGGQMADVIAHHAALLTFAEHSLQVQDTDTELNAAEIKRLLQALAEGTGGH